METIANGTPLMDITQGLLFKGFTEGKWHPDLMMLLAEPTMYMLLAIAEAVGLDPKIDEDDEITTAEDIDEEDEEDINRLDSELGSIIRNPAQRRKLEELEANIKRTEIPREIQERVEEIDFSEIKESLLAKPNKQEQVNKSLLQRT